MDRRLRTRSGDAIRGNLGLRIMAGVTIALSLFTGFAVWSLRANLETGRREARSAQLRSVRAAATLVSNLVGTARQELRTMASMPSVVAGDEAGIASYLASLDPTEFGFTGELRWVSLDGASAPEGGGTTARPDRVDVRAALNGSVGVEAVWGRDAGYLLNVAIPTLDALGRRNGALAGSVRLSIDDAVLLRRLFGTSEVTVYDRDGRTVFAPGPARLGTLMPSSIRSAARNHDDGLLDETVGPSGATDRVVAFAKATVPGWTMVIEVPRDRLDRPAIDQFRRSLIVLGVLVAATLAAAVGAAVSLDRARRRLSQGRAQLAAVIDQLPAGVAVVDHDDRLMMANDPAQRALELIGDGSPVVLGASLADRIVSTLRTATERDESSGALEVTSSDAPNARYFAVRARRVVSGGRSDGGIVAMVAETTAARSAELRRVAMAALVTALAAAESTDQILEQIVARAAEALGASRVAVLLADPASGALDIEATDDDPRWVEWISRIVDSPTTSTAAEVAARHVVEVTGVGEHPWRTTMLPLPSAGRVVGAMAIGYDLDVETPPLDLGGFAAQVALALDRARRREIEHDVSLTLQRTLLTVAPTPSVQLSVATRYRPSAEQLLVGGDFFDVIDLGGADRLVVIGDVVGHGLAAAATMGQVKVAIRAFALEDPSPSSVLSRLDEFVTSQLESARYTTAVLVEISVSTGRLRYAIAGHPPPLMRRPDGQVVRLNARREPLLGLPPLGGRGETEVVLEPGTTALCLYTDGLIEEPSVPIDEGIDAVAAVLAARSDTSDAAVEASADAVMDLSRGRPRRDDIALVYAVVRV